MCQHDHTAIDSNFKFCPYCGQAIEQTPHKVASWVLDCKIDGANFTPNHEQPPTKPTTWHQGYRKRITRNFYTHVRDNIDASSFDRCIANPYFDILRAIKNGMSEFFTIRQFNRFVAKYYGNYSYLSLEKLRNLGVIYCVGTANYGPVKAYGHTFQDKVNVYTLVPNHAEIIQKTAQLLIKWYQEEIESLDQQLIKTEEQMRTVNMILRKLAD